MIGKSDFKAGPRGHSKCNLVREKVLSHREIEVESWCQAQFVLYLLHSHPSLATPRKQRGQATSRNPSLDANAETPGQWEKSLSVNMDWLSHMCMQKGHHGGGGVFGTEVLLPIVLRNYSLKWPPSAIRA